MTKQAEQVVCEIFLALNEDGHYEVGTTDEEASERLIENAGGHQVRIVKITAKAAAPTITEAEIDIRDDAGHTEAVEAEAA